MQNIKGKNKELRIKNSPSEAWIHQSSVWVPNEIDDAFSEFSPHRCRGRPSLKWDSAVRKFCDVHFDESWQNLSIDILSRSTDVFQQYFCNHDVE